MGRLAGISGRKAVAAFCRAGWHVSRQRGSHVILKRADRPNLVIQMHRSVAPFLLASQIRRADLTEDEFLKLLT